MKIGIGVTPAATSFVQTIKREKKRRERRIPVSTRYDYIFYRGRESHGVIYYDGNIGLRVGIEMFSERTLEGNTPEGEYGNGDTIMNVDRNSTITTYTKAFYYTDDGDRNSGILYYDSNAVLGVGVALFSSMDLNRIATGGTYSNRSNRMTVDKNGIVTDYR